MTFLYVFHKTHTSGPEGMVYFSLWLIPNPYVVHIAHK